MAAFRDPTQEIAEPLGMHAAADHLDGLEAGQASNDIRQKSARFLLVPFLRSVA